RERGPAALEVQREITRVLAEKLRALNDKVRDHPAEEDRPARAAPPAEVEQLLSISNVLELPRGSWLFGAGSAANACFLVVRGAVEVISKLQDLERRVALAGPGELVGYLAVLEGAPHGAAARVRECTCLLEFPARPFLAHYERNSSLQHAIHQSLLRSLARTNTQLTRLISHARLTSSTRAALELEKALHAQVVNVKNQ